MTRLAVWSIDGQQLESSAQPVAPKTVGRSHIGLERNLEDWIVNDVTLIADGLTLVGRQVSIDGGRLDLLAIDSQDRWVVIEIKTGALDSMALSQALNYAASLARLGVDELYETLEPGLNRLGNPERLAARVQQQLDGEEEPREIAVLLVGAGIDSGLERMNEFLGRFGVPIAVVSFEVFELDGGSQLLIRDIVEERTAPPRRRLTVEAIRRRAVEVGVEKQFDRFVNMAKDAGLAVQPQRASVRIAPLADRRRFLMWVQPRIGNQLGIWVGAKQFAEFFPHIDEENAVDALGRYEDGAFLAGDALDRRLDEIERFLTDNVQQTEIDGA